MFTLGVSLALSGCGQDDEGKSAEARPRTFAYEYDERVTFGYGGEAERFMVKGWSEMEPKFAWTIDKVATLGFRLPHSEVPVTLSVTAGSMTVPPQLPAQPVDVYIGGEKIAHWDVGGNKRYTATIPKKFTTAFETAVFIEFRIPRATAPADFAQSGDRRKLGLRVAELTISTYDPDLQDEPGAPLARYGQSIRFVVDGHSEKFRGTGWGGTERDFTWTDATTAFLNFKLAPSSGPVTLCLEAAGMNKPPKVPYQSVFVSVNGEQVGEWQVANEMRHTVVIAKEDITAPSKFVVELKMPNAVSPAEIGGGSDQRKLGLRVKTMLIVVGPMASPSASPTASNEKSTHP